MTVDWVLFDADGVLQQVRDGWLEELTRQGGDQGEAFVVAVFEAETATMAGGDFAAAMGPVLARFGIDAPLAEVLAAAHWIDTDEEMLGAVRRLRASGVRCALTTNQQSLRGTYMAERLGYDKVFDATFYSYALGVAKPDQAYFEAVLARTGAAAERTLFVDDNAANVAGARTVGLHAELFPRGGGLAALGPLLTPYGLRV